MQLEGLRTSRVVALALLVGTFFVAQEALTDLASGRPLRLANDVEVVLRFWVVWALLTPLVLRALRRWPPDTTPSFVPVVAHVGVALVLASLHTIITLSLRPMASALVGTVAFSEAMRNVSLVAFTWGVFTSACFYAVVVMVYAAVRFRTMSAALVAELTRAKLDTLRSQLRPHFLFNTLNAISVFVTEDAEKARTMLLRLSALLRRSLDEEAHEVTLRQELAVVDDYLDIMRGRFGDQLMVRIGVDPAVLEARVPVFVLQPLLENAIEHGKGDDNRASLSLSAGRDNGDLRIVIEDDGPGLGDATIIQEGIGLRNTRARLQHMYGSAASVQLRSEDGPAQARGTRVEIRIPFSEAQP